MRREVRLEDILQVDCISILKGSSRVSGSKPTALVSVGRRFGKRNDE
jgi:hypothetical protein